MDGWVDGQMDGWMNEWIDGWVDKCLMDQTTNGVFFFSNCDNNDSGYHDNMYKDNIVPKCWYYLQKVPLLILKLLVVDLSLLN